MDEQGGREQVVLEGNGGSIVHFVRNPLMKSGTALLQQYCAMINASETSPMIIFESFIRYDDKKKTIILYI
jgi:hypothetical protein